MADKYKFWFCGLNTIKTEQQFVSTLKSQQLDYKHIKLTVYFSKTKNYQDRPKRINDNNINLFFLISLMGLHLSRVHSSAHKFHHDFRHKHSLQWHKMSTMERVKLAYFGEGNYCVCHVLISHMPTKY